MNYWQAILKQTTDREFMTRLWRLALPVSLQSMMFSLLGLIDIMMVSQLGTTAVAAVGLGNRVFFFNLLVIAGLSGGVSVNTVMLHVLQENLPFGGVNGSGIGATHGEAGFRDFSHDKAVLRNRLSPAPLLFAPYGARMRRLLGWMQRLV